MKEKGVKKVELVKIGKHYLDPTNIAGIKEAKCGLYIIMLRSEPEPQYPLWLSEKDLDKAKKYFDIIGEKVQP
jgi:hypothetical protein